MNRRKTYRMAAVVAGMGLLLGMTACGARKDVENTESLESVAAESMAAEESAESAIESREADSKERTDTEERADTKEIADTGESTGIKETVDNGQAVEGSGGKEPMESTAAWETENTAAQKPQTTEKENPPETEAAMPQSEAATEIIAEAEESRSQTREAADGQQIPLNPDWEYADHSKINTGAAVLYRAPEESGRKGIVIGVNAGHGTAGGSKVKTLCHPDGSAKITGGSTAAGATEAAAVSGGMTFQDGTTESAVTLRMAQILRNKLLASGYDVLMLRDGDDVQLDNVARTVICNNVADCHIALHWDSGDGKDYDKGCFYISVPEGLKSMEPVASHWQQHDTLGADLVEGLRGQGAAIYGKGTMSIDLTQTSYSTIPSVDMELGNGYSDHSDAALNTLAEGLLSGIQTYFGQ